MTLREIVCMWAIKRFLKMVGFLYLPFFRDKVLDFAVLFFLSRELSDCIDAKISTDSLYSPGSFFLLSYLQEPKSTSSQQYSKRYLCFLLLFFDNFGQWEGELIQHDSTVVLLGMPLAIYSGISIVLLANRLLPLVINFEYSKIVFVSTSVDRRNSCIVAPFQLCQNLSAIEILF
jgi:hypothetical protein